MQKKYLILTTCYLLLGLFRYSDFGFDITLASVCAVDFYTQHTYDLSVVASGMSCSVS